MIGGSYHSGGGNLLPSVLPPMSPPRPRLSAKERRAREERERRWDVAGAIARNDARQAAREARASEPDFIVTSAPVTDEPTWAVRADPRPGIFEQPRRTPEFQQPEHSAG